MRLCVSVYVSVSVCVCICRADCTELISSFVSKYCVNITRPPRRPYLFSTAKWLSSSAFLLMGQVVLSTVFLVFLLHILFCIFTYVQRKIHKKKVMSVRFSVHMGFSSSDQSESNLEGCFLLTCCPRSFSLVLVPLRLATSTNYHLLLQSHWFNSAFVLLVFCPPLLTGKNVYCHKNSR